MNVALLSTDLTPAPSEKVYIEIIKAIKIEMKIVLKSTFVLKLFIDINIKAIHAIKIPIIPKKNITSTNFITYVKSTSFVPVFFLASSTCFLNISLTFSTFVIAFKCILGLDLSEVTNVRFPNPNNLIMKGLWIV